MSIWSTADPDLVFGPAGLENKSRFVNSIVGFSKHIIILQRQGVVMTTIDWDH